MKHVIKNGISSILLFGMTLFALARKWGRFGARGSSLVRVERGPREGGTRSLSSAAVSTIFVAAAARAVFSESVA